MVPFRLIRSKFACAVRKTIYPLFVHDPHASLARFQSYLMYLFSEKLYKSLPLEVPQRVLLESTNCCNFMCNFCPTGDRNLVESMNVPRGFMDFKLLTRIVDRLGEFPQKIPVLYLQSFGEPLLHRDLATMVAYVKEKDVAESVQLITNGAHLTAETSRSLLEAGLDLLIISVVHVTSDGYLQLTGTFSDYDLIRNNVKRFFHEKARRKSNCIIYSKILNFNLSREQVTRFLHDFNPISDIVNVEYPSGWSFGEKKDFTLGSPNRFNIHSLGGQTAHRLICPAPFASLVVTFDGLVTACFRDWSRKLVVGSAKKSSLNEIWNGETLKELRYRFITGGKERIPGCTSCSYIHSFTAEDDLDRHKESLAAMFHVNPESDHSGSERYR